MAPVQGDALPAMAGGINGVPVTARTRAALVPQALFAETASVQTVKPAGQSTVTALRLEGPEMVPHVVVQL